MDQEVANSPVFLGRTSDARGVEALAAALGVISPARCEEDSWRREPNWQLCEVGAGAIRAPGVGVGRELPVHQGRVGADERRLSAAGRSGANRRKRIFIRSGCCFWDSAGDADPDLNPVCGR